MAVSDFYLVVFYFLTFEFHVLKFVLILTLDLLCCFLLNQIGKKNLEEEEKCQGMPFNFLR